MKAEIIAARACHIQSHPNEFPCHCCVASNPVLFPVLLMLQPLIKVINQLVLHAHDLLVRVRH